MVIGSGVRGTVRAASVLVALMLASCGGGGGGGSDAARTSLSLSRSAVAFDVGAFDPAPDPVDVVASYVGDGLVVGYPDGQAQPVWLQVSETDSNPDSPKAIRLEVRTDLATGDYSTILRFATGRVRGSDDFSDVVTRDLPVTLRVRETVGVFGENPVVREVRRGDAVPPASLGIDKSGGAWDARTTASWVRLTPQRTSIGGSLEIAFDASGLALGVHQTTVEVFSTDANPSSRSVPVTLRQYAAPVLASPATLAFDAATGADALPAAQALSFDTANGSASDYTVSIAYDAGASDWLTLPAAGRSPTALQLGPNTSTLAPGRYVARLTVTTANANPSGGLVQSHVDVTYVQRAARLVPSDAEPLLTIDRNTTASALTRTLQIGDDGSALQWTARIAADAPIEIVDGSGNTRTDRDLVLRVKTDALETLSNGRTAYDIALDSAHPLTGNATQFLRVTLDLSLPTVGGVMPVVAVVGQALEHTVGGTALDDPATLVLTVGGQSVTPSASLSPALLRFVPPSLAPGEYEVKVGNALGIDRGAGRLVVVAPQAESRQFVAGGAATSRPIHDAERNAVYMVSNPDPMRMFGDSELSVFRRGLLGLWSRTQALVLPFAFGGTDRERISLSADGRLLWVANGTTLQRIDLDQQPLALQTELVLPTPSGQINPQIRNVRALADGTLALLIESQGSRFSVYDPVSNAFTLNVPVEICSFVETSGDGSVAFVLPTGCRPDTLPALRYRPGEAGLTPVLLARPVFPTLTGTDRLATRRADGVDVFDIGFARVGGFASPGAAPVFSPDGLSLFSVRLPHSTGNNQIDRYDLRATGPDGNFAASASISAERFVGGEATPMGLSGDGSTLFVGSYGRRNASGGIAEGADGLLILPAP